VNLSASGGGQLLFPAVQTYADGAEASYAIDASGAGSKINLSHLSTMAGSVANFGSLAITASTGGEVDLAGAITGSTVITTDGINSTISTIGVTQPTIFFFSKFSRVQRKKTGQVRY
jgi:hypothetical protein